MLASRGYDPCIIGLDIMAMIGLSPLGMAALWCCKALWLVRQTTPFFARPGIRYHRVLCLARPLGGLDIALTLSILEVWGLGVR